MVNSSFDQLQGLHQCLSINLQDTEARLRVYADYEHVARQLTDLQQQLSQERLEKRALQRQLSSQVMAAERLQKTAEQQHASFVASTQLYEGRLAQLTEQYQADLGQVCGQLASVKHDKQVLEQNLHQERKTFEASLLSRADGTRSTPWKDKLLAVRSELVAVRQERDMLATRQLQQP